MLEMLKRLALGVETKKVKRKVFEYTDKDGYKFEATSGMPTDMDDLFLHYLKFKLYKNKWKPELNLSCCKMLKSCGVTPSQLNYERLRKSLEKWIGVYISFSGIFYDGEYHKALSFKIMGTVVIENDKLLIRFNEYWIKKIKHTQFYNFFDFDQIRKLRSNSAFRFYEILSKAFYTHDYWEIDMLELAKKMPLNEKYISGIIPKIQTMNKRIKHNTSLNVSMEIVKQDRGNGKFIFKKIAYPNSKPFKKIKKVWGRVNKKDIEKIMNYFGDNPFETYDECAEKININVELVYSCISILLKTHMT